MSYLNKNIYLVFFIIIFNLSIDNSFSQTFVKQGMVWSAVKIFNHDWLDPYYPPFIGYTTQYVKSEGDTMINSKEYIKLFRSLDSLQTWNLAGLIRQDSNKVYLWKDSLNSEIMLYDFSLNPGDSGITSKQSAYIDSIIYIVDSTNYFNYGGTNHKRIYTTNYCPASSFEFNEVWVEGIGAMSDILKYSCYCFTPCNNEWELLCLKDNGTVIYQNPQYNTCFYQDTIFTKINTQSKAKKITIFPNPTKDYIKVNTSLYNTNIIIYDNFGKLVKRKKLIPNYSNKVILPLQTGIYFYIIKDSNKVLKSGKIITIN